MEEEEEEEEGEETLDIMHKHVRRSVCLRKATQRHEARNEEVTRAVCLTHTRIVFDSSLRTLSVSLAHVVKALCMWRCDHLTATIVKRCSNTLLHTPRACHTSKPPRFSSFVCASAIFACACSSRI